MNTHLIQENTRQNKTEELQTEPLSHKLKRLELYQNELLRFP